MGCVTQALEGYAQLLCATSMTPPVAWLLPKCGPGPLCQEVTCRGPSTAPALDPTLRVSFGLCALSHALRFKLRGIKVALHSFKSSRVLKPYKEKEDRIMILLSDITIYHLGTEIGLEFSTFPVETASTSLRNHLSSGHRPAAMQLG